MTITGSGFTNASTVSFGGVASYSFTINDDGSITAYSPAASVAGTVDITVSSTGGTSAASSSDQYTYS